MIIIINITVLYIFMILNCTGNGWKRYFFMLLLLGNI